MSGEQINHHLICRANYRKICIMASPTEFEVIQRLALATYKDKSVATGIGDDGAIINAFADKEKRHISTVHYHKEELLAQRPDQLVENAIDKLLQHAKDCQAKPRWLLLNIARTEIKTNWITLFSQRLAQLSHQHQFELIGGDTTQGVDFISFQMISTLKY